MTIATIVAWMTRTPPRPWGEELPDEGWMDRYAIHSWDDIDADQYIRFYPHLVPRDGVVPSPVIRRLESCVAERILRCRRASLATAGLSMGLAEAERIGAGPEATLYPRASGLGAWLARRGAAAIAREHDEALVLDRVLDLVRRGALADLPQTALFASLSGIHPAYVWPAAVVTQERDAAAGWFGVLARGRPATMPSDIAAYLLDILVWREGVCRVRDRPLADLLHGVVRPATLRRAAERAQRGERVVVRPAILSRADVPPPRSPQAPVPRLRGADPFETSPL